MSREQYEVNQRLRDPEIPVFVFFTANAMNWLIEPVKFVPVEAPLSLWRRWLARLPGFCKQCGRRYVTCAVIPQHHSTLIVKYELGKCCPHDHEGHATVKVTGGVMKLTIINRLDLNE